MSQGKTRYQFEQNDPVRASSQTNKPTGDELWATEMNSAAGAAKCNMSNSIARLSGLVIAGGANDNDKQLQEEFYICSEETAEWMLASNPKTYSITNYTGFVPIQVRDASDKQGS